MNYLFQQLTEQIAVLKQERDDLDDLIDDTYKQIEQMLVQGSDKLAVEELMNRIREWRDKREELDDFLERLYVRLDQFYELYPGASSL